MGRASKTLTIELPTDVMAEIEKIEGNADDILGGMTQAGAREVESRIRSSVPASFRGSAIMNCLRVTKVYKTPTDDGINTKVAFYGYFRNHLGKMTPAPLVANVFEFGSSKVRKQPFLRKSFSKSAVQKVMLAEQKRLSGGLLDD